MTTVTAYELQLASGSQPTMTPITDSDVVDGLSLGYLKLFGLWGVINHYRTSGTKNRVIKFQVVSTLFLTVPHIFCQYLSYFMIPVDVQKATFLNLHCLPALQLCCKILVFWFRIDSQCRLYDLVRSDFLESIPAHKKPEAGRIYRGITKMSNVVCTTTLLLNISIIATAILVPGIPVDYISHHTGDIAAVTTGKKKILGGWYPLPIAESPFYEAIFAYEVILVSWGVLLAVYICLFYQVLMCLYAQYRVLCHHVSTLTFADLQGEGDKKSLMYQQLYAVIKDHQKLLSYTNKLRSVYNPLVTMVLGVAIFVLIIAAFQFLFGGTGTPIFMFKSLQFLSYHVIEVSMFCFGSSFIQTTSSDLVDAIYSSDWYLADVRFRKTAQMVMVRARKGTSLTAIRMYPVNLETMMNIFQFTYTASTLISRTTQ